MTANGCAAATAGDAHPPIDLDFCDRDAAAEHADIFGGALRYVDHEVFGDAAGIMIEDSAINGVESAD